MIELPTLGIHLGRGHKNRNYWVSAAARGSDLATAAMLCTTAIQRTELPSCASKAINFKRPKLRISFLESTPSNKASTVKLFPNYT